MTIPKYAYSFRHVCLRVKALKPLNVIQESSYIATIFENLSKFAILLTIKQQRVSRMFRVLIV